MQAFFLLRFGLRSILVQQLESLGSGVAVKGILKLGDRRRDFEAHVQDLFLALEADVLWPSATFVRSHVCKLRGYGHT